MEKRSKVDKATVEKIEWALQYADDRDQSSISGHVASNILANEVRRLHALTTPPAKPQGEVGPRPEYDERGMIKDATEAGFGSSWKPCKKCRGYLFKWWKYCPDCASEVQPTEAARVTPEVDHLSLGKQCTVKIKTAPVVKESLTTDQPENPSQQRPMKLRAEVWAKDIRVIAEDDIGDFLVLSQDIRGRDSRKSMEEIAYRINSFESQATESKPAEPLHDASALGVMETLRQFSKEYCHDGECENTEAHHHSKECIKLREIYCNLEDLLVPGKTLHDKKMIEKMNIPLLLCQCNHRHCDHHPISSVNFSAGKCKNCDCKYFLLLTANQSNNQLEAMAHDHFAGGHDTKPPVIIVDPPKGWNPPQPTNRLLEAAKAVALMWDIGNDDKLKESMEALHKAIEKATKGKDRA